VAARKYLKLWILFTGIGFPFLYISKAEDVVDDTLVREWVERQEGLSSLEGSFIQERKLRTLRKPVSINGRFWFSRPDRFRWEVGKPVRTVAVQEGAGWVIVAEPLKKKAEIFDLSDPEKRERIDRLGFMSSGFFSGYEAFSQTFSVRDLVQADGQLTVELAFRNSKMALAVRKVEMRIDVESDELRRFALFFRDGSVVTLLFYGFKPNGEPGKDRFKFPLNGYEVVGEKVSGRR